MYKKLLDNILKYDSIVIFHHQRPDGDSIFSSLALYQFIKDNFKDKKVKIAGFDRYERKELIQKVSDKFIRSSLGIAVDTSSIDRVDDERFKNCLYTIKIDHHPPFDNYADLNIVDTKCAAAAELIADILFSKSFSKYQISEDVCRYLYSGMVTDTINFRTTNTTYKTFEIAAKLIKLGNIDIAKTVESLMDDNIETFEKVSQIRNYLKVEKQFGYILLRQKDIDKLNMDPIEAKNHINEIGKISDLNIWLFAVEVDKKFDISVRSKRGYVINELCREYGGGGHPNASGVKQLSEKQLKEVFHKLIEMSTKKAKNVNKPLK